MDKTRLALVLLVIVILFVSVVAGTIVFYYGQAHEKITFVDVDYLSYGAPSQSNYNYKWTLSLNLKNTGNTDAIINNIILDGQPYSSFNPIPAVNPPIENGYVLSANQNVTITIQGTNTTAAPNVYAGRVIYVVTAIGNYSTLVGS
jgi:hypothetical protein